MEEQQKQCKTAIENEDFTFEVGQHKNLSFEEFKKLQSLSACKWLVFREPHSPHPYSTKRLNFADAL